MSENYAETAADAYEMIAEFGQPLTLWHQPEGVYDTATGKTTDPAPVSQNCLGVDVAYKAWSIDGTLILAGDKKLLLSPLSAAGQPISPPAAEDWVTYADGSRWTIKDPGEVSPAGTPVLFKMQMRRG